MKGEVAVITGGNGMLGNTFAKGLAEAGANVFILGRNAEKSEARVTAFKKKGLIIQAITCDVLDEESVNAAVEKVLQKAGKVDILINGAGGNMPGATIMPNQSIFDISIDHFGKETDLNLLSTLIPSIAFAKPMVAQGKGCIINVSSMAATLPLTRQDNHKSNPYEKIWRSRGFNQYDALAL